ncbi:uncharacterized protein BROUX77_003610 [Berkeleyomyces rouxiae]|uniref:uncharacterized protein n=1 Tax=Berkeleyomyces rouxiae TaxID=2035830 RepID=UPI003B7EFDC2
MEGVGVAANLIAVINLSVKAGLLCFQYAKDVKNASVDIERLKAAVHNLKGVTEELQRLLRNPDPTTQDLRNSRKLDDTLQRGQSCLDELNRKLQPHPGRKLLKKVRLSALKWPFKRGEVDRLISDLRLYNEVITQILQVHQTGVLHKVSQNVDRVGQQTERINRTVKRVFQQTERIDKNAERINTNFTQSTIFNALPIAVGASFDSFHEGYNQVCFPNTRAELLQDIQKWSTDPSSKTLFWLNGMAGTGKSTISRIICRQLKDSGRLGASFFFKRGEADRGGLSRFVTTITAQLLQMHPEIAEYTKSAIETDPIVSTKDVWEQFEKLVKEPLAKTGAKSFKSAQLVFVIDALDECDRDEDVRLITRLFYSCAKDANINMKVKCLITSRPELPIRLGFNAIKSTVQDLVLHNIPPNVIKHDIAVFLESELIRIKDEYNESVSIDRQLSPMWPGRENMQTLINMAVPLFIFAATTCRFLSERRYGNPNTQLSYVLRYHTESQVSQLDATYMPVLDRLTNGLPSRQQTEVIETFRTIVGAIITVSKPLSTAALGRLLAISKTIIDDQLDSLHSVLSIPKEAGAPVRLLHLSFRDFLVDPAKERYPFHINEKDMHKNIASRCLRVMEEHLRTDICNIAHPGARRSDIDHQVVQRHIPPELEYACMYWVKHLELGKVLLDDNSEAFKFLRNHFLHWLEVMSLLGRASENLSTVKPLLSIVADGPNLGAFLEDALRFIRANLLVIDTAPLQIYSSVLIFTPKKSVVRQACEGHIQNWLSLHPRPRDKWDQCQQVLEGHKSSVDMVAVSPNGSLVASGSGDATVRLWRCDDGVCVQELRGHESWVTSLAFSPDGRLVASGSGDATVRLWRCDNGVCVQELRGHESWVTSLAFSPDGRLVASGSGDATVRLWRCDNGVCVQELRGHERWVTSLTFSPDGHLVASGSDDHTVRLWRCDDGVCVQELRGHEDRVTSLAFSPDGRLVASGSGDATVRLWRCDDGVCVKSVIELTIQNFWTS